MKTKRKWIVTLLLLISFVVACGKEEPTSTVQQEVPAREQSPNPASQPVVGPAPTPASSSPAPALPAPSRPEPPVAEKKYRVGSYSNSEGGGVAGTWHFFADGSCSFVITGGAPFMPDPTSSPFTREQCEQLEAYFKFSADNETLYYMGKKYRRN